MDITQLRNESTVLYLPGLFGGGWSWDEVVKRVYCRNNVVVQDPLCAIGKSPEALVQAFVALIDREIEGLVTLVGTSYGGMVAMMVAQERPDRIERVILSDSAGFNVAETGYAFDRHDLQGYARKLANTIYHHPHKIRLVDLERLASTLKDHTRAVARLMNVANTDMSAPQHLAALHDLNVPVHAVWGANDLVTPIEAAELTLRRHGATIDLIDECGHSPMCECPAEFAELLNLRVTRQPVELQLAV